MTRFTLTLSVKVNDTPMNFNEKIEFNCKSVTPSGINDFFLRTIAPFLEPFDEGRKALRSAVRKEMMKQAITNVSNNPHSSQELNPPTKKYVLR